MRSFDSIASPRKAPFVTRRAPPDPSKWLRLWRLGTNAPGDSPACSEREAVARSRWLLTSLWLCPLAGKLHTLVNIRASARVPGSLYRTVSRPHYCHDRHGGTSRWAHDRADRYNRIALPILHIQTIIANSQLELNPYAGKSRSNRCNLHQTERARRAY